jgi:hypothetical protein
LPFQRVLNPVTERASDMKKAVLALATAATIGVAALAMPSPALAWRGGWGWGPGLAGGLVAGAVIGGIASSAYAYGPGYGYYGGRPTATMARLLIMLSVPHMGTVIPAGEAQSRRGSPGANEGSRRCLRLFSCRLARRNNQRTISGLSPSPSAANMAKLAGNLAGIGGPTTVSIVSLPKGPLGRTQAILRTRQRGAESAGLPWSRPSARLSTAALARAGVW